MQQSTQKLESALGFHEIRNRLADYCVTEAGKRHFLEDPASVAKDLREDLVASVTLLAEAEDLHCGSFAPLPSLQEIFHKVSGQLLSFQELSCIVGLGIIWRHMRTALVDTGIDADRLCPGSEAESLRRIQRLVTPEGSLIEDADTELTSLQAAMSRQRERIHKTCYRILRATPHYFSSKEPVFKQGRSLLPLSLDFRDRVPGILISVSESGATLYVEPPELVPLNNDMVLLRERREARILALRKELSDLVSHSVGDLRSMEQGLIHFDLRFARYCLWESLPQSYFPKEGSDIFLEEVRHPLMSGYFVPLTLSLSAKKPCVIVTGPNAGGKTISLKTLGLMVLMQQFALPIPASSSSRMPEISQLFCIIGDSQSLDASLSTYSARLKELALMLEEADAQSLVLIDECGSHTDPNEGASLACALLDELRHRGARVWVTTHLGMLKAYALEHDDVASISMEFDEETQRPSFQMREGLSGGSHALDIAAHCGIGNAIIARAREYLQQDHAGDLIANVEKQLHALEKERAQFREKTAELQQAEVTRSIEEQQLNAQRRTAHEEALQYLREFRRRASQRLDRIISDMQDKGFDALRTEVKDFRDSLSQTIDRHSLADPPVEALPGIPIEEGADVIYRGHSGRVAHIDKKGNALVELKGKRIWIKCTELQHAVPTMQPKTSLLRTSYEIETPQYQSDVRGQNLDEAIRTVDTQLQRAVAASMTEIVIVHGKGEGILQEGIRRYLRAHSLVREQHAARPEDGGHGKTYVQLKC